MPGKIYLLDDEHSELTPMEEAEYKSEDLLQHLLATHPDLLAGDQMNSDEPRRWLLVTREMSVPDTEGGSKRWSLDHLFLDQEAIPTLVEVKRSTDTRIRREVVGQLLDYAANAVVHWPVEEVKARFESRCADEGLDPDDQLNQLLDEDQDASDYWQQVRTNLQAGRIRMVFVADVIPRELRRIVEFLNQQMVPAEVLAVEVKRFVGEGVATLVPRVIGQTEVAVQKKAAPGGTTRSEISEPEFLDFLREARPKSEVPVFERLIEWSRGQRLRDRFWKGGKGVRFSPTFPKAGREICAYIVHTRGEVKLNMRSVKHYAPFDEPSTRSDLLERIKDLPGFRITDAGMEGFPTIPTAGLEDEVQFRRLIAALDWMVAELRSR